MEQRICGATMRSAQGGGGEKYIEGHAAVFNQRTDINGVFYEVIDRGAFDGCDFSDVALFINHNQNALPLARTTSGTLTLATDNVGLAFRANLDVENNATARDLYSAVKRGDVTGCSFAFVVDSEEWQDIESDMPTRRIKKIKRVGELSIANYPAYEGTNVDARAKNILATARKEFNTVNYQELENHMRRWQADNKIGDKPVDNRTEREKDNEEYERWKAANQSDEKRAATQPPHYIPGQGFIPADEGRGRMIADLANEKRTRAGEMLKAEKAVVSPFNAIGEQRAMTLNPPNGQDASIVVPTFTSNTITPSFSVVSSLIDGVAHLSLPGGESFRQPFTVSIGDGNYTKEGEDYADSEMQFDYALINRCKVTAYCELTEEFDKLPAAEYSDTVFRNIRTSMRKVLTHEILVGKGISDTGEQPRLVGIFSDRATAIDPATDFALDAITDTTLDDIVFSYGSEEHAESPACLLLSKSDLLAFSKVRTSTKERFYDIKFDSNTGGGTINGVPFIIDSACKPISIAADKGGARSGDFCMAYGSLSNYLLCEFSPLEVKKSDDYRFRKGITAFRGSVFVGGNCIKRNGFIRVKKL